MDFPTAKETSWGLTATPYETGQYKMQTADCRLQTADWVQNAD